MLGTCTGRLFRTRTSSPSSNTSKPSDAMTTPTLSQPITDKRRHVQRRRWVLIVLAVVGLVASGLVYDRLFRERPAPYFESDAEHFLYGSIGAESIDGVPYWI